MQKQLANGLILRTLSEGVASDREQLPQFYADVNGEGEPEEEVVGLAVWTEDLMNNHPQTTLDDIFVIVDPAHNDRVVSATLLIPQTWRYEEIPISVGRPELVGTLPDYRGRGLVRELFKAVHERSEALGNQIQVITGISHFYRQFGYTMALDLGDWASFPLGTVGDPAPESTPSFTLRPAVIEDIDDLSRWHNYMARERLVTEIRSPEQWRHEIVGHRPRSLRARSYLIIVNDESESVGYIELSRNIFNPKLLYCPAYVVGEESSYVETFGDVMRGVKQYAEAAHGMCPPLLLFAAGGHPALYLIIKESLGGSVREQTYKWYLRVADPIAFFRHIQPVLERRLEGSGAHRYTGELRIGFHNMKGIALHFERGRMMDVTALQSKDGYDIRFPWHLLWNIVFGDHSPSELNAVLPEVNWSGAKAAVLLDALFPKKKSWIEGLA